MVETRTIVYDEQLQIEAYQFVGIMQKFPNHFHDCYVVGFVEKGNRHLSCRGDEYDMEPGDMLLLNPRDNHTCESRDGQPLDYRCLNIDADVMVRAVKEVIGCSYLPNFEKPVAFQSEMVESLRTLHQSVMKKETEFLKEELFYILIEQLVKEYTNNQPLLKSRFSEPIKLVKKHLDLCQQLFLMSRSYLLLQILPNRYLLAWLPMNNKPKPSPNCAIPCCPS